MHLPMHFIRTGFSEQKPTLVEAENPGKKANNRLSWKCPLDEQYMQGSSKKMIEWKFVYSSVFSQRNPSHCKERYKYEFIRSEFRRELSTFHAVSTGRNKSMFSKGQGDWNE